LERQETFNFFISALDLIFCGQTCPNFKLEYALYQVSKAAENKVQICLEWGRIKERTDSLHFPRAKFSRRL